MGACVFLTGATGFLGTQIARRLCQQTDHALAVLVRSRSREEAVRRLSRVWWSCPDLIAAIGSRVEVVVGSIDEPRLALDAADYGRLSDRVTHVVHAAADLQLGARIEDLRGPNVEGTRNVLELARAASAKHEFTRFAHVSTAYVAGRRTGSIAEDSLSDDHGFYSNYERSKYEAEVLVRKASHDLPVSVFRPGMVIGDSRTGTVNSFNVVYFPFRLYFAKRPFLVPVRPSLRFNFVPVDYVADAVVRLTLAPEAEGRTFHLTAPSEALPTARELVRFLRTWARERLGLRLPPPLFLPMTAGAARAFYRVRGVLRPREKGNLDTLMAVVPYFTERRRFLRDNVDRLLGPYDLRWREVMDRTMEFAVARGFFHRPDETVHERLLSRLKSRSLPVTYHDIVDGAVVNRPTRDVREEMLGAAAAMRASGIEKGDRVAVVGPNCTRYLTIDVAIGILGAVSVPIYNTSSVDEILGILSASRPRLFFVGNPDILERLDRVDTGIPIVSFCRVPPRGPARDVTSWDAFLAKGNGRSVEDRAPVDFGDIATIRFTSGTCGRMKAACFDHANLRWMAESVGVVMSSWRAMNAELSYLSYLPMNHVVEGILTGYSPYYSSAGFRIFFLEAIEGLPAALRRVRPHVFFSVPRFYEKVWQVLSRNRLTRAYVRSGEGAKRRLLRPLVRWLVLRKTGLGRCGQLVVGSAPSAEDLLRDFRDLGIEIYNAYGLTEAPLVTINRVGANRMGTVGEPLPLTEVSVAEDGEVLVSGPQVARGYLDGEASELLGGGVLRTGDVGQIRDDRSLVLRGRKKEIIVTAYGKNLDPVKIEAMLRGVPGVEEALVVGEGRPFCAAILWTGADAFDEDAVARVEKGLLEVNARLSHPEQVKRWAFLSGTPSIEDGEMTASLKLKRGAVTARLSGVVEALYGREPARPGGAVRIGGVDRAE